MPPDSYEERRFMESDGMDPSVLSGCGPRAAVCMSVCLHVELIVAQVEVALLQRRLHRPRVLHRLLPGGFGYIHTQTGSISIFRGPFLFSQQAIRQPSVNKHAPGCQYPETDQDPYGHHHTSMTISLPRITGHFLIPRQALPVTCVLHHVRLLELPLHGGAVVRRIVAQHVVAQPQVLQSSTHLRLDPSCETSSGTDTQVVYFQPAIRTTP